MPPVKTWSTKDDWETWANESPSLEKRIFDSSLKLPFRSIDHFGTGASSQVVGRWRFGQNQSGEDTSGSGHTSTVSNSSAEILENGLFSSRNGFASVNEGSDFRYPDGTPFYMSCWIRSDSTDYSNQTYALISGSHIGDNLANGDFNYAFVVNSTNHLRVFLQNSSGVGFEVSPVGGEVTIDTNWHHLLFWSGSANSISQFVVDNKFGNNAINSTIHIRTLGAQIDIASSSFFSENGFSGIIDELVISPMTGNSINTDLVQLRYISHTFISPVIDTDRDDSFLSSITAAFVDNNDSSVLFSFRASDTPFETDDYSLDWTGFTTKGQVLSEVEKILGDLGVFVKGRFHQVRVRLSPTNIFSSVADSLQIETSYLQSLTINTSVASHLLIPSKHTLETGTIIGQIAKFSNQKELHKVTLYLNITSIDRKLFVVGTQGNAAFQAVNFQSQRDSWVFQPSFHWDGVGWKTSGLTINNDLQTQFFSESDDVALNAPLLSYLIFLDNPGEYDIWGYGFVSSPGMYWAFDDDETHLRRFTLGDDSSSGFGIPRWTRVGRISSLAGGLHTFIVYLSDVESVRLDQWYFTQNLNFNSDLDAIGEEGFTSPIPNSRVPFITAVRLRPLTTNGNLSSLKGQPGITAWSPSNEIIASGKSNYTIQDNPFSGGVTYDNGISIEFWQIGGSSEDFAAWNYSFDSSPVGDSFISTDYGQNYTIEP